MKFRAFAAGLFVLFLATCGLLANPAASVVPGELGADGFFTNATLRIDNLSTAGNASHINIRDRQGGPVIRTGVIPGNKNSIETPVSLIVLSSRCEYDVEIVFPDGEKISTACNAQFPTECIASERMINPGLFDSARTNMIHWPQPITSLVCTSGLMFVMIIAAVKLIRKKQAAVVATLIVTIIFSLTAAVFLKQFQKVRVEYSADNREIFVSSLITNNFKTPKGYNIPIYANESTMLEDGVLLTSDGSARLKLIPGEMRIFTRANRR